MTEENKLHLNDADVAKAQRAAAKLQRQLERKRKILTADQLVDMKNLKPRLEQQFDFGAYFFSIDGILKGEAVKGALLGGECMLVFAPTLAQAVDIAARGLRSTIDLMFEEYASRNPAPGELIVAGGRRARPIGERSARALEQDDTLRRMIRDAFKTTKH